MFAVRGLSQSGVGLGWLTRESIPSDHAVSKWTEVLLASLDRLKVEKAFLRVTALDHIACLLCLSDAIVTAIFTLQCVIRLQQIFGLRFLFAHHSLPKRVARSCLPSLVFDFRSCLSLLPIFLANRHFFDGLLFSLGFAVLSPQVLSLVPQRASALGNWLGLILVFERQL